MTRLVNWMTSGRAGGEVGYARVVEELRRLARRELERRPTGRTGVTSLIDSAFIKLMAGCPDGDRWQNRAHFYGSAVKAMRQVLVDEYRRKLAQKRGGGWKRVGLDGLQDPLNADPVDVLAVHEALTELARVDSDAARVTELRFFGGFTVPQVARQMGVSERKVCRDWQAARAWLARRLGEPDGLASEPSADSTVKAQ